MANVEFGGIQLSAAGYDIARAAAAPLRRGAGAPGSGPAVLDMLLQSADFQLAGDVALTAATAPGQRRGAAVAPRVDVAVTVAPGESAVLLVEDDAGLLTWQFPADAAPAATRRGSTGAMLRFTIVPTMCGATGVARRRGPIGDWIAEKIAEPVRVRVLRFLVARTIDAAVSRIEGDMPTGPVVLTQELPVAQWLPGPLVATLPETRPARVLLLVHGTFSTTAGSYGGLVGTPLFAAMCGHYDLILGHDHHTLADAPRANAEAILTSLHALDLPAGSVIHAVAFSRGGLVCRILCEELLPRSPVQATVERVVFVGCTNAGTLLAEPQNWEEMVNIYTNLIASGSKLLTAAAGAPAAAPWVGYFIKSIGRFVQLLPQMAISERRLPGLAAMEPDGEVVTALNAAAPAAGYAARYFAVTSVFEPGGDAGGLKAKAVLFLADLAIDRLFGKPNDLVVHTASMTDFGIGRHAEDVHALGTDQHIFHTVYFTHAEAIAPIARWLGIAGEAAAVPPPAMAVEPPPTSPAPPIRRSPPRAEPSRRGGMAGIDGGGMRDFTAIPPPASAPDSGPATEIELSAEGDSAERFIAAEMEPAPRLDRVANVYVTVTPDEIVVAAHAAAAATPEAVAVRTDKPIMLRIIPRSNCAVFGKEEAAVDPRATDEVISKFRVRGLAAGPAELLVEARQGVRTLASFMLAPVFIGDDQPLRVTQALAPTAGPEAGRAVLRIYEFEGDGTTTLRFDLSAEDPELSLLETVRLPARLDLPAYVTATLKKIDDAWNLRDRNAAASEIYAAFLRKIANDAKIRTIALIPEKIRRALWKIRTQLTAIQVISEEPHIPWELMYLFDPDGQASDGQGFFAERGLVRWLHNAPPRPRRPLGADAKTYYVVPDYLDANLQLPAATAEKAMLAHALPNPVPVTATSAAVGDFLASGAGDCAVLHFACHGESEQKDTLEADLLLSGLDGADGVVRDTLSWQSVKADADFGSGGGPLVFLNACQTGRGGAGLAGIGGFADAFIRPLSQRGASAFIGALWSVDDRLATVFADTLYTALKDAKSLPEAVSAARTACQTRHDFTWLAYSVYCFD